MAYGDKRLGGGYAAGHAVAEAFPILAATATGNEKNVIREELTTVACWRLDDLDLPSTAPSSPRRPSRSLRNCGRCGMPTPAPRFRYLAMRIQ